MANEITIPLLPCHSIDDMLEFYRALGFEVTYHQNKPNNYAVVERGGIELHFFSMKEYVPANSYSTCYVRTEEIDALYAQFCSGLRQQYGRVPSAGIPRVLALKNKTGRREFIVVDPGGNWIRIGQVVTASSEAPTALLPPSELSRATHAATLLDEAGYYDQAAQKLDVVLAKGHSYPVIHRVQALVLRSAVAVNKGDYAIARQHLETIRQLDLTDEERTSLSGELERMSELEQIVLENADKKA